MQQQQNQILPKLDKDHPSVDILTKVNLTLFVTPNPWCPGCSCIPNFMLFFSQRFLMQKNYEDNGFLATCYCVEEEHFEVQSFVK